MKKLALLACGFMCVMFIAAAASAGPRAMKGPNVNHVARPAVNQKNYKEMRHHKAYRMKEARRTSRAPRLISRPRVKGDIWGANYHRRAAARHYASSEASSRARSAAHARIQARIKSRTNCADGTNCGNASRSKHGPSARAKSSRSTLNYSDAQKRRWQKIFELHAEKWQPPKLKELESGCNDFARCM